MSDSDPIQILSRLADEDSFVRQAELRKLSSVARSRAARNALVLGPPRAGKTELLKKCYDRLFAEGADVAPVYYSFRPMASSAERFARDYLAHFLAQFIAFRRNDPRLTLTADEPVTAMASAAAPEDYLWVKSLTDSFSRALAQSDPGSMLRAALSAPLVACVRSQVLPFVLLDNVHLLADSVGDASAAEVRSELFRALSAQENLVMAGAASAQIAPRYALCGLRRPVADMIPSDEGLLDSLETIRLQTVGEEPLDRLVRATAKASGIEISDSAKELMINQLGHDIFYIRALLDGAASRGRSLKTFMEFERLYTEEVIDGRIGQYLGALMRSLSPAARSRRAMLEALNLAIGAGDAVPLDAVVDRIREHADDPEGLLGRMHARELLEIGYGFVSPPADPVLADYVRSVYRSEVAGARRPLAGELLLAEKLKDSYRLMMSRYNRSTESQVVELLSSFDFQSAPASLLDQAAFEKLYRGASRVQARRALDDEHERARLPQIVVVADFASADQPGMRWRLFAATGFEGGIYSDANEVLWLVALINSKEPLDLETVNNIDRRLEAHARTRHARVVRWYISKEGFSAAAGDLLARLGAYRSTYTQMDLLHDYLMKLRESKRRPASEFELVIPIEEDAELIAARTVEQIARAADFDQEAINQIKTALIEACINAAEHSDSPDRRIYQRFAIETDRITITVMNKGKAVGPTNGEAGKQVAGTSKGSRGRGLKIIRALMDEVRFEPTDDGTSLVMTKILKRPQDSDE
ncbi:MAG TPA: ATP-binding protein [Blastocatellia bacterium]|nr:ATP-binding protein [Blastocatellia bacterium]